MLLEITQANIDIQRRKASGKTMPIEVTAAAACSPSKNKKIDDKPLFEAAISHGQTQDAYG